MPGPTSTPQGRSIRGGWLNTTGLPVSCMDVQLLLDSVVGLAHRRRDIVKVIVDMSQCDLHGLCVEAAPEVFEIDDNGVLQVLIEAPPEDLRAKVEKAVRECPTGAITIQE